jgi:uncharacterized DUF497 family protein
MYASTAWRSILRVRFLGDPLLLTVADLEHSKAEERWFSIGRAANGSLLSVVYLWSEAEAATKIRIISARKARQTEIRQYEESL